MKQRKNVKIRYYVLICIISTLVFGTFFVKNLNFTLYNVNSEKIQIASSNTNNQQWLTNNNFSTQEAWFITEGNSGDNSSVDAFIENENGNFRVYGEKQIKEFSDPLNDGTWQRYQNENFLFPDTATITSEGCYVAHDYNEAINQTHQYHSVHWRKNINVGYDIFDYIITSASLEVIFNASVSDNLEVLNEVAQYTVGDFATFYILISDIEYSNPIRVAYNRTISLGLDFAHTAITDTILNTVNDQDLIRALEAAFEKDPNHSNCSLTIGIDVYCEDNRGTDRDTFYALIIKSLNLTLSFERRIEKFTHISWNQIGDKISGRNTQITEALFNLKCKVDDLWPLNLSAFSEIRILINVNPHKESILLSSLNTSFQEAKLGGYDVKSLISKEVNISVSIQLFIANNFGLDSNITISIDDVSLCISYRIIEPGIDILPIVIGLTAGIVGLILGFTLYQTYLKYPPLVRKIRKIRKKINKDKKIKPTSSLNRELLVAKNLQNKIKLHEYEPTSIDKKKEKEFN